MTEKITQLKQQASYRNWNGCIEKTAELFKALDYRVCIKLLYQYFQQYLPVFQKNHPEAIWVLEYLDRITQEIMTPFSVATRKFLLPENHSEFEAPGSNGFVIALEDFWDLVFSDQSKADQYEKCADIMAHIITIKLTYDWGTRNLDEWLHWYHSHDSEGENKEIVVLTMMDDPLVAKLETKLWSDLADQIQNLLNN